jgi:hypothetical protein
MFIHKRQQRRRFPLETPQHAVDQTARGGLAQDAARRYGLGNGSMGRDPRVQELVKADEDEGQEHAVPRFQGLPEHLFGDGLEPEVPAAGPVGEFTKEAALIAGHLSRE